MYTYFSQIYSSQANYSLFFRLMIPNSSARRRGCFSRPPWRTKPLGFGRQEDTSPNFRFPLLLLKKQELTLFKDLRLK